MKTTWILVADGARARILQTEGWGKGLIQLRHAEHEESPLRASEQGTDRPGRTREINYFDLEGALRLVDLPGYGYARASRKDAEQWMALTREFLRGRSVLRRVCLLADSRHGLKSSDLEIMDLLDEAAVNYQIVLTKTDKIKPTALTTLIEATSKKIVRRPAAHPVTRATSAEKGDGIPQLRAELAAFAVL